MGEREALGMKHTDATESRGQQTRERAKLWRAVRAAIALVDASRLRAKGVYDIAPDKMLRLRDCVDDLRDAMARHDRELMESAK
jgi:hypothetical protein